MPSSASSRQREGTEWSITYWYNANENKLPRVLLVGDSICNGYQSLVRDELAGVAYVSFYATSKCVTDRSYLKELAHVLDEYPYAVVHFNNGLHSLSTDRKEWEAGLRAAFDLLKAKGRGAKIIWVTSTPLKDPELTAKSRELNAIAARVVQEYGFPTNDLFALMDPMDRAKLWSDTFHYHAEGKKMQAKQVADAIRALLGGKVATTAEARAALAGAATPTGPDGKLETVAPAAVKNAEIPVLSGTAEPFTFAVLGDTHYKRPEFAAAAAVRAIGEDARNIGRPLAFVCHTGDAVEGGTYEKVDGTTRFRLAGYEEMREELQFAARDLAGAFRTPLFFAIGNHDRHDPGHRAYREEMLPLVSRHLGAPVERPTYAFRYGSALFVFLDHAPADYDAQRDFLRGALAQARETPGIRHTFLFCHYPLWPVARAGFYNPRLSESLLPLLKQHAPDAFFCGHTHNILTCVRTFDGTRITQIQGVSLNAGAQQVPLEERRALLFDPAESSYYWGYLEPGIRLGYYTVTVDGERVRVQLRSAGAGVVREFEWRTPGEICDLRKPEAPAPVQVTPEVLAEATAAALCVCPAANDRAEVTLSLNGGPEFPAQIAPAPNLFWGEQRLPIPAERLADLKPANTLRVGNPGGALFGLAHARLEVTLRDGRILRSTVSDRVLYSSPEAQAEALGKLMGRLPAPADRIQVAAPGEALGPIEVRFGEHGAR